jgi:hypothetical protein
MKNYLHRIILFPSSDLHALFISLSLFARRISFVPSQSAVRQRLA